MKMAGLKNRNSENSNMVASPPLTRARSFAEVAAKIKSPQDLRRGSGVGLRASRCS